MSINGDYAMYTYDYMGKNTESTTTALCDHVDKNTQHYLISIDLLLIEA